MAKKLLGVSRRAFAQLDGCNEKLVRRAISEGRLSVLDDGSLDPDLAGTGWRKSNRQAADEGPVPRAGPRSAQPHETPAQAAQRLTEEAAVLRNIAQSEQMKEHYLAELRRLEFEVKSGDLLPKAEVVGMWANFCIKARQRLLGLPTKLAPVIASEKDPRKIQTLLEQDVNDALEELSAGLPGGAEPSS